MRKIIQHKYLENKVSYCVVFLDYVNRTYLISEQEEILEDLQRESTASKELYRRTLRILIGISTTL
jgi:hypothetical protein